MSDNIIRGIEFYSFKDETKYELNGLRRDIDELRDAKRQEEKERQKSILDFLYSDQTPFPALEIKHCPLCGENPHWWTVGPHLLVKCNNTACKLYNAPGMSSREWNERRA